MEGFTLLYILFFPVQKRRPDIVSNLRYSKFKFIYLALFSFRNEQCRLINVGCHECVTCLSGIDVCTCYSQWDKCITQQMYTIIKIKIIIKSMWNYIVNGEQTYYTWYCNRFCTLEYLIIQLYWKGFYYFFENCCLIDKMVSIHVSRGRMEPDMSGFSPFPDVISCAYLVYIYQSNTVIIKITKYYFLKIVGNLTTVWFNYKN